MSGLGEILIAFSITITIGLFTFLFVSHIKRLQRRFDDTEKFGRRLGSDLDRHLVQLREELQRSKSDNEQLRNRIQNLETIVTSQNWDFLSGNSNAPIIEMLDDTFEQQDELSSEELAAKLAKRIR